MNSVEEEKAERLVAGRSLGRSTNDNVVDDEDAFSGKMIVCWIDVIARRRQPTLLAFSLSLSLSLLQHILHSSVGVALSRCSMLDTFWWQYPVYTVYIYTGYIRTTTPPGIGTSSSSSSCSPNVRGKKEGKESKTEQNKYFFPPLSHTLPKSVSLFSTFISLICPKEMCLLYYLHILSVLVCIRHRLICPRWS